MAATVGQGTEKAVSLAQKKSAHEALLLDTAASCAIESYCDDICEDLQERLPYPAYPPAFPAGTAIFRWKHSGRSALSCAPIRRSGCAVTKVICSPRANRSPALVGITDLPRTTEIFARMRQQMRFLQAHRMCLPQKGTIMKFSDFLKKHIVLFDGAFGTLLQKKNGQRGYLPERLNEERPELIADIHRAYLDAGAGRDHRQYLRCEPLESGFQRAFRQADPRGRCPCSKDCKRQVCGAGHRAFGQAPRTHGEHDF